MYRDSPPQVLEVQEDVRDRILVVDDDLGARETLRLLLESEGHHAEAASSGSEALAETEKAARLGRSYALALVDLRLGDMSGLEVLRRVKEHSPNTQTVIITGNADVESAVEALRQGAQEYLLKPYHIEEMRVIVAKLLAARRDALHQARLLEQARRRVDKLGVLNRVGQTVTRSLNLDTVLVLIMEQIQDALQVEACSVALVEEGRLIFKVALGPAADKVKSFVLDLGQGLVGCCVQENKPILVNDVQTDSRHFRAVDDSTQFVSRSILCVPMAVPGGRVIGAIEAINRRDGKGFDEDDLDLLQAISVPASVAVDNARLHESLAQRAEELKKALAELQELDRLKSEFVQNVSHELRTPLTLIRGYVDLLQNEVMGALSAAQKESVSLVAMQTEVLTRLVNDIILMQEYELDASQVGTVSLRDILKMAMDEVREKAESAGHVIATDIAAEPCWVLGNREHLVKVFANLLDNAIKFDPDPGEIELTLADQGGQWEVRISDAGIGIPEHELAKIFHRFYQVDGSTTRRFGGVGLGLAVAKEIVEAHGGHIWVKSQEGVGSTFGVCLPRLTQA